MNAAWNGALSGGLFFGAGEIGAAFGKGGFAHVTAHAAAGCISASAGGAKCGSGALSAGFATWAGSNLPKQYDGLIARMVIGGTVSELGGGRFGNGAGTAAFGYLFNHLLHVGISGRLPFIGGGSANLGVSWQNGKLDAGFLFEGDIPPLNAGRMLGKVAAEIGYQPGDFDSIRGSMDSRIEGHYKLVGGGYSSDANTGKFSGASLSIGPGLGLSVSGTRTNTISLRQVYREVIRPGLNWVKGQFGQ